MNKFVAVVERVEDRLNIVALFKDNKSGNARAIERFRLLIKNMSDRPLSDAELYWHVRDAEFDCNDEEASIVHCQLEGEES